MAGETPGIRPGTTPVPPPAPRPVPAPPPPPPPAQQAAPAAGDQVGASAAGLLERMMAKGSAVPVPTLNTVSDMADLASTGGAVKQAVLGVGQMQVALDRARAMGLEITSGADAYNATQLNEWIAHNSDQHDAAVKAQFVTGKETDLFMAIRAGVENGGKPQSMADVMTAALKLTSGDMAKALLTVNNTLRAISRPGLEGGTFPHITKNFPNEGAGEAFLQKYLDGSAAGIPKPGQGDGVGDDWYHTFTSATTAFIGNERGLLGSLKDAWNGTESGKFGTIAAAAGAAFNAATFGLAGAGTMTQVLDAAGEQFIYGFCKNFEKDKRHLFTNDAVLGVEPGELVAGIRGGAMGAALAGMI